MSPACPQTTARNAAPVPQQTSPTARTSPTEPTASQSEHRISASLVAQLRGRIEVANPRTLQILQRIADGEPCRTFASIETEGVLIDIEKLLAAMEIIHGSFHECDDLDGVRRVCEALDPVIAMTVSETAKLRAKLFGAEA